MNSTFAQRSGITRRRFLQVTAGGLAWYLVRPRAYARSPYHVGIGRSSDPYTATQRAVAASQEWPGTGIAGHTVIIKPNLVTPKTASTGATTDPHVVRALVDLALKSGATQVLIAEGADSAKFTACGYDFFNGYDPAGRVSLVSLADQPTRLVRVPGGLAYRWLYMPALLLQEDVVFITVAKLKTHLDSVVTLSMKNAFGLPPVPPYQDSWLKGRFAMHKRGVNQVIVDLNLVRPADFAVVDGIWGMEGNGPLSGTPVRPDTVIAGRNALAVDRICLEIMDIPQQSVYHLTYAARSGLGPSDTQTIEVHGDPLISHPFLRPESPPVVEYPKINPKAFVPGANQHTEIVYGVDRTCWTRVEVVRTWELWPTVVPVRTLRDWAVHPAAVEVLEWDGRDDEGNTVSPGFYTVRVQATSPANGRSSYATNWVWVAENKAQLSEFPKALREP